MIWILFAFVWTIAACVGVWLARGYVRREFRAAAEPEVTVCIRKHRCATPGEGPCNGIPRPPSS